MSKAWGTVKKVSAPPAATMNDLIAGLNNLKLPSAYNLANVFAKAMPHPQAPSTGTMNNVGFGMNNSKGPTSSQTNQTKALFNHQALLTDVKDRYLIKINKGLILGSMVSQPFLTGYFYHIALPDHLILSDGSLFIIHTEPNEKGFIKAQVQCKDDTYSGIQSWYQKFVRVCHNYGYYCHPFWSLQTNVAGE